ncbi:MAG: methyltransferase [Pseudomonadota bacterium]
MVRIPVEGYEIKDPAREAQLEALVGPAGWWKQTRDTQLSILEAEALPKNCDFLDLGCGTLRLGLPLIAYLDNGRYTGVDIDEGCMSAAKELVTEFDLASTKEPTLIHSSTFGTDQLSAGTKFDVVWCFQVMIHLTQELSGQAMAAISSYLKDSGSAYVTIRVKGRAAGGPIAEQGSWRDFAVTAGSVEAYTKLASDHGLRTEVMGPLTNFGFAQKRSGSDNVLLKLIKRKA